MRKLAFALVAAGAFIISGAAVAADVSATSAADATWPSPASIAQTTPAEGGAPATAPVITSTAGATESQFGGDPNEIICRDAQAVTGTLFKRKVCHSRREWAESQKLSQSIMSNMHKGAAQCGGEGSCGMTTP
jgi:hypothetical protein